MIIWLLVGNGLSCDGAPFLSEVLLFRMAIERKILIKAFGCQSSWWLACKIADFHQIRMDRTDTCTHDRLAKRPHCHVMFWGSKRASLATFLGGCRVFVSIFDTFNMRKPSTTTRHWSGNRHTLLPSGYSTFFHMAKRIVLCDGQTNCLHIGFICSAILGHSVAKTTSLLARYSRIKPQSRRQVL